MSESNSHSTLQRPYLLRAMHEWMTDNDLTPHIVIDVETDEHDLPVEYANDGKLVINISYSATQNLVLGNDSASFEARFGGVSRRLEVPMLAILGIYARESGQGMIFSSESAEPDEDTETDGDASAETAESQDNKAERSRPQLKIIK